MTRRDPPEAISALPPHSPPRTALLGGAEDRPLRGGERERRQETVREDSERGTEAPAAMRAPSSDAARRDGLQRRVGTRGQRGGGEGGRGRERGTGREGEREGGSETSAWQGGGADLPREKTLIEGH